MWLFSDWLDLPLATTDVPAVAEVELQASRRDPYRRLSRVFHIVGRRASPDPIDQDSRSRDDAAGPSLLSDGRHPAGSPSVEG